MNDKAVQEQAYDVTRSLVAMLRARGQLPPQSIYGDDDFEDTISDVYAYHILPMVARFDPAKAKLSTFIYPAVMRWAPRFAWRTTKGGINTSARIQLVPVTTTDAEDDEDAAPDAGGSTGDGGHVQMTEVVAYPEPPEGYESPGSDEWEDTQLRGARVAHMRRLIESLPRRQREAVQRRVLVDKPKRGRMPDRATVCEIARALRERFSMREIESLKSRGYNHQRNGAVAGTVRRASPQGSPASL